MAGSSFERTRRKRIITRISVAALSLISLLMFLASRGEPLQTNRVLTQLEDGLAVVLSYLTVPIRGTEDLFSDLRSRQDITRENEALKREINRLRDTDIRANTLALKIAELETLLNVKKTPDIIEERIAARAVSEREGPFVRSALINSGKKQGIKKGYGVMTSLGLYGHVVRAGSTSSRVLMLTDLNSRIPVMTLRTDGRAILSGDNTDYPGLSYVSNFADWQNGDEVITSGDDGILPRGLPIGIVRELRTGELKVELYALRESIDWVLVVPFSPVTAPDDEAEDRAVDEAEDGIGESPALSEDGTVSEGASATQQEQAQTPTNQNQEAQSSESPQTQGANDPQVQEEQNP